MTLYHDTFHIFASLNIFTIFHTKGTADSQPESHHPANNVDKNGTTNYPPANQGTTSDNHAPITRKASFGSRHESPPVSPHAPHVKPRMVAINCFIAMRVYLRIYFHYI